MKVNIQIDNINTINVLRELINTLEDFSKRNSDLIIIFDKIEGELVPLIEHCGTEIYSYDKKGGRKRNENKI
jgi:hypothetical protein